MRRTTRRGIIRSTGATLAVGGMAGCLGNGDDDTDDDGGRGDRLDDFLEDARGFAGQIQDLTGEEAVRVDVAAGDDGLSFDPAGIRVDAGTTVDWAWTGQGGGHDVASTTESAFEFQSQRTEQAGHTFEEAFDEEGVALYVCQPHRGSRMKGGIDVV